MLQRKAGMYLKVGNMDLSCDVSEISTQLFSTNL